MGDLLPFPPRRPSPPEGCICPVIGAVDGSEAVRLIQCYCPVHGSRGNATGTINIDTDANGMWRPS